MTISLSYAYILSPPDLPNYNYITSFTESFTPIQLYSLIHLYSWTITPPYPHSTNKS
jgi:hypothetical protein